MEVNPADEVKSLYAKLEQTIVPLFYSSPLAFTGIRRSTIALNGSHFNAQRMLSQYLLNAYGANSFMSAIAAYNKGEVGLLRCLGLGADWRSRWTATSCPN